MARDNDKPWQFKFTFALSIVMLLLVFGYFTQSFLEIRKVKPVRVAIERIREKSTESIIGTTPDPSMETANKSIPDE